MPSKEAKSRRHKSSTVGPSRLTPSRIFQRLPKILFALTTIFATLFGLWLVLGPRVSVSAAYPLNPSDPFSAPFIMTNRGNLSIYNVGFTCNQTGAVYPNPKWNVGDNKTTYTDLSPVIQPGESRTIPCGMRGTLSLPIVGADINIQVSFRPSYWPRKLTTRFRFLMWIDSNKHLRWLPQPIE